MGKPLLRRMEPDDFRQRYGIHGSDHLIVEGAYSHEGGPAKLHGWYIRDTRFTEGMDKWARWLVISLTSLGEVRDWVRAGGPALWDPERRKADKNWRPIPEGMERGQEGSGARGEVPGRADPGVGPQRRVGGGRRVSVRGEGRGKDRCSDAEPGRPTHREFRPGDVVGKRYAVCPGWVTSENYGDRHFIDFGALTWLYGVRPSECLLIPHEMQDFRMPSYVEELIWLHPQQDGRGYDEMREELARGDDAFKLD